MRTIKDKLPDGHPMKDRIIKIEDEMRNHNFDFIFDNNELNFYGKMLKEISEQNEISC